MEKESIMYVMPVICAWCDSFLYNAQSIKPGQISHGICSNCKNGVIKEIDMLIKKEKRDGAQA